jgi:putative DNA primase/helicase
MTKPHIKRTHKHITKFNSENNSNKYLELADAFLTTHPEVIYWTERNDSKKGLFYRHHDGVFKACSCLEIENMLIDFVPENKSIILPRALSESKRQETIKNIKMARFFYRDVFNQEHIINFKNGFFDVVDGELIPHSMDIISTIQLPFSYDPKAECPLFLKVVNESLENDFEKIMILQEFFGYCLTSNTERERALFIVGAACSGKSTVLEAIKATLGEENCSCVRMDMLADCRFTGNLIDKYANIDTEIPQNMENYEDALKKIISGESITINTKFIPTYEAKPTCKLIFAANDLPRISDTSDAVFRRILLLYFNNVVAKENIDYELKAKIKASECPGIFNWAFEGLKRLRKNKEFTYSKTMVEQVEELKLQNNSVYFFINENYEVTGDVNDLIIADEIYDEYKAFCGKVGAKGIFKSNIFAKEAKKCFVKKIEGTTKRINGVPKRVWTGLRKQGTIDLSKGETINWDE